MTLVGLAARKHLIKKRNAKLAAAFPNGYRCQKCLEVGHWSYECTQKRKFVHRSSRTKILNKRLAEKNANDTNATDMTENENGLGKHSMPFSLKEPKSKHAKRNNVSSSSSDDMSSNDSSSSSDDSDSDSDDSSGSDSDTDSSTSDLSSTSSSSSESDTTDDDKISKKNSSSSSSSLDEDDI
ncbi:zinc finger CCHC domain-containing protein 10-like [Teleopsis dalmanni]|uniref:zinc finger CCHC domain-containing protein 10-like n=1 Tax=Teleopsis dalmanni TaxID=139649 RepID=UPI000D32A4D3|nr:zinc finger CCHC domain-containing protein 10-like [Teleopsis dalmanni]XP_037950772.1 zinc finger CCHC domain-containing protein 10-like [Teleopsis dalmanni]